MIQSSLHGLNVLIPKRSLKGALIREYSEGVSPFIFLKLRMKPRERYKRFMKYYGNKFIYVDKV
jgi:hypothetical protein